MLEQLKNLYWNWKCKRQTKRKNKFVEQWINKQFRIAGHKVRLNDVLNDSEWFSRYTITTQQELDLKKWSLKRIKKIYPYHQQQWIEQQYSWLVLQYGLKTINN